MRNQRPQTALIQSHGAILHPHADSRDLPANGTQPCNEESPQTNAQSVFDSAVVTPVPPRIDHPNRSSVPSDSLESSEPTPPATVADAKRHNLNALLITVFAVLQNASSWDRFEASEALERLTVIMVRFVAGVLTRCGVPNAQHEANDLVQDIWVRFLTRDLARRFDQERSDSRAPFLWGVCRMCILERLRHRRPLATLPVDFDLPSPTLTPHEQAVMNEVRADICAAIDAINPKRADAIRTKYWGLKPDETITDATRYGRVFQGKLALRSALSRHVQE